jgi:hypothetical protein
VFRRYLSEDGDAKILQNPSSGIDEEVMKGRLKGYASIFIPKLRPFDREPKTDNPLRGDRSDVIEALSSDRPDQAFDIGCLPRRSGCGNRLLDPQFSQLPLNDLAIDAIPVPDNVLRNGVIWKGVMKQLLRSPFCGGMRRNIGMNNAAPLVRKNDKDLENAEGDCLDSEEIGRDKLLGVIFQERAPYLRGRFWMPDHVLSNSRLGDTDSQFEQFAVNSRSASEQIVFAHGADELTDILGNSGFSRLAVPAFPGPK